MLFLFSTSKFSSPELQKTLIKSFWHHFCVRIILIKFSLMWAKSHWLRQGKNIKRQLLKRNCFLYLVVDHLGLSCVFPDSRREKSNKCVSITGFCPFFAPLGCTVDLRAATFETTQPPTQGKNQEADTNIATFSPNGLQCSLHLVVLTSPVEKQTVQRGDNQHVAPQVVIGLDKGSNGSEQNPFVFFHYL